MSKDYINTNKVTRVLEKQKNRIRFETSIILALVISFGWLCSVILFHLGLQPLWVRYLLSVTIGYSSFLLLYWFWMKYIINDISENMKKHDEDAIPTKNKRNGWDFDLGFSDGFDLEAIGIFVGIIAIVLVSGFVLIMAPAILIDFLTSEIILVFLFKKVSSIDEKAVFLNILKNTYIAFLVLCGIILIWAVALQVYFPGQDSFSSIVSEFFRQRQENL